MAEEQRTAILTEVQAESRADIDQTLESHKKLVKHLEVILIIVGTFLNGFGD